MIAVYLPKGYMPPKSAASQMSPSPAQGRRCRIDMRQMGLIMKLVTAKVAGRFDGKGIREIVRSRLSA